MIWLQVNRPLSKDNSNADDYEKENYEFNSNMENGNK